MARDKGTGKTVATFTDVKMIPSIVLKSPTAKPVGTPELSASPEAAQAYVESSVYGSSKVSSLQATHIFETTALYGLKDISASSGRLTCTLPVTARVENIYSTLHGGCIGKSCHQQALLKPCICHVVSLAHPRSRLHQYAYSMLQQRMKAMHIC